MMRFSRRAALVATLFVPVVAGAQERERTTSGTDFNWAGSVPQGAWVRVHNVNGGVYVEPGTGDRVEITATKRARRGNPEDVRVELVRGGAGDRDVIVCAMWNEGSTCGEGGVSGGNNRRDDRDDDDRGEVSVEFRVKLPAGVRVSANTVNGRVRVTGATAEVEAHTVNGGIEATSTTGPVRARSVNGSIDVHMSQLGTEGIDYSTVNGSMKIRLPATANADIELSTVNGSLESDFPLTMQGRMDRRNLKARLGNGGPRLSFRTVNGSVHLLRN